MRIVIATALAIVLPASSFARDPTPQPGMLANQQTCYSAQGCTGKVLSNRDRHNCKTKSRGKSWRSSDGTCYSQFRSWFPGAVARECAMEGSEQELLKIVR